MSDADHLRMHLTVPEGDEKNGRIEADYFALDQYSDDSPGTLFLAVEDHTGIGEKSIIEATVTITPSEARELGEWLVAIADRLGA